ncbi:MAG: D-alanyl-D-alanine carboxypeptidase family protein [Pseudonocardiaceae bacterium]
MSRSRAVVAVVGLTALLGVSAPLGAAPGYAQPAPPPPPPVITPDTSSCPQRIAPPAPVDMSEVPAPGTPAPTPVPVPDRPVGGSRMGECGVILPDDAPALPDGISATSWVVADARSGDVLAAKDPHGRHRPASTIKLLTALLTVDRLPPDKVVTATQADADQEGSSVGIGPGGTYTVRQLLTGLLLVSGNDAAHALAQQLGGVPATLQQMNDLAGRLGALDTHAATPSGLDGPGMSTSAYDLALVFGHVLARPLLAELLTTRQVRFPGFGGKPGYVVSSDNKLLAHYDGALGGKTGFTDDARHTFVGAAVRDGRPLIVVLMRGEQRPVPMWQQAAHLLDYGFALPTGHPVGRLATEAQVIDPQAGGAEGNAIRGEDAVPTDTALPGARPAPPRGGAAAQAGADNGAAGVGTALLWSGLAVLVLAVLGVLVVRTRS